MKQLTEYISESILADDDELNNRNFFSVKIDTTSLDRYELRDLKKFKSIDIKTIKSDLDELFANQTIVNKNLIAYICTVSLTVEEFVSIHIKAEGSSKTLITLNYYYDKRKPKYWVIDWTVQKVKKRGLNEAIKKINQRHEANERFK